MTAAQLSSTAVAQQSSLPIASQSAVDGIKSTVATVTIQNLKRNKLAALLKRLAGVLFFCCKPSPPAKSSEAHPIAIAMTALSTAELKAKAVASKISQFWIQLRGFSAEQCIDIYLENAFLWPWAMWSSMFPAKVECPEMSSRLKKQQKFLFAACTDAVGILNFETKVFSYSAI
jgi:hypothetical protein